MSPVWYYAILLFLGTFAMLILGTTAVLRRRSAISGFFFVFSVATAVYSYGYAMEITRTVAISIRNWNRFEYMGLPFIASFLLIFVIHFVGAGRRIPGVLTVLPIVVSLTIMVIRQTNPYHGLYYSGMSYVEHDGFLLLFTSNGPWYWVLVVWNVLCLLGSALLISIYLSRAPRLYRRQGIWLMVGTLIPVLPYIVYLGGYAPYGIDINPAAICLATVAFYVAIFKHNLFTLVPISRDRLVETMTDAVFVLDGINRVVDVNPAARRAFGIRDSDPIGLPLGEAFPHLAELGSELLRVESDSRIWEISRIGVAGKRGNDEGFLVVGHDVTEKVALVEKLEKIAREDVVTGLLNRQSWDQAVHLELSRLARYRRWGSVIYLDLDHFKLVNDQFGHAVGDSVLQTLARILKEGVRGPDLVGRYGGEEFVIFLPESHPDEALEVAERLRESLKDSPATDGHRAIPVTGSFGVAGGLIDDATRLDHLVARADRAMYISKQTGRNRVTMESGIPDPTG